MIKDDKNVWVNLHHPCYGVDIWREDSDDDDLSGQGYIRLGELRRLAAEVKRLTAENERLTAEKVQQGDWLEALAAAAEVIGKDILWHEKSIDTVLSADYQKGFINGLIQARYLIGEMSRRVREE